MTVLVACYLTVGIVYLFASLEETIAEVSRGSLDHGLLAIAAVVGWPLFALVDLWVAARCWTRRQD